MPVWVVISTILPTVFGYALLKFQYVVSIIDMYACLDHLNNPCSSNEFFLGVSVFRWPSEHACVLCAVRVCVHAPAGCAGANPLSKLIPRALYYSFSFDCRCTKHRPPPGARRQWTGEFFSVNSISLSQYVSLSTLCVNSLC
ncbi:hypothetical protein VPH35_028571 [Triticum aestivum]